MRVFHKRGVALLLVAAMCVLLAACAGNEPKSAAELYDRFMKTEQDNYSVVGDVNMSMEAPEGEAFGVTSMTYAIGVAGDVTKEASHIDLDVDLDFGGFALSMKGDAYVDGAAHAAYLKMDSPLLGEAGGWTKYETESIMADDTMSKLRGAFEKASLEKSGDNYLVTMTVGDAIDASGLGEEEGENLAEDFGQDMEVLRASKLVYTFDKDFHLIRVEMPEITYDSDGVTTKATFAFDMSNHGKVGAIVIPEDALSAEVAGDVDGIGDVIDIQ